MKSIWLLYQPVSVGYELMNAQYVETIQLRCQLDHEEQQRSVSTVQQSAML